MLSIITPVLNGAAYIEQNIRSVQQLSIPHEHIVVDGQSTDGTLDILKKYPHLRVVHQSHTSGMYGAIQEGIDVCSGNYICYLNCDDQLIPFGFIMLYNTLIALKADLVVGDSLILYQHSHQIKYVAAKPWPNYWLKVGELPFLQPSSIFSRSAYFKAGGINANYRIAGDFDLFRRISKFVKIYRVNVPATIFLKHGASLGDKNTPLFHQEIAQILKQQKHLFTVFMFRVVNFFTNGYWSFLNRNKLDV
ncbi:MAG: glycosyltransferase [Spirosomataceae bacterium]